MNSGPMACTGVKSSFQSAEGPGSLAGPPRRLVHLSSVGSVVLRAEIAVTFGHKRQDAGPRRRIDVLRCGCFEGGRHPAERPVDGSQPMMHFARGRRRKRQKDAGEGSQNRSFPDTSASPKWLRLDQIRSD